MCGSAVLNQTGAVTNELGERAVSSTRCQLATTWTKEPQLKMADEHMGPVMGAARTGDLSLIKSVA